eukprot:TRINITY_DN3488_c0_g1_i1.p1 TRINITY_DN3488_c0_g1~~TRINITY_DN3488_c0_g1_i1.p1  ORF type:complete len:664 (+),score=139.47 TRINITY_DN3488_c0_g1_i1:103-2094(+)
MAKQSRAEVESQTLEKFQSEFRPLLQKSFDGVTRAFVQNLRTTMKESVANDLRPMLEKEMSQVMGKFKKEVQVAATEGMQDVVKQEFAEIKRLFAGAGAMRMGGGNSPRAGSQPVGPGYGAKRMVRGNMANTKNVKQSMVRKSAILKTQMQERELTTGEHFQRDLNLVVRDERELAAKADPEGKPTDLPIERTLEAQTDYVELQQDPEPSEQYRQIPMLEQIVMGTFYEKAMAVLIMFNAILIGVRTDYCSRNVDKDPPEFFHLLDVVFMFVFFFDVSVRMHVQGWHFFTSEDRSWNIFDLCIVMIQVGEESMRTMFGETVVRPADHSSFRAVRVLRVIRILRLMRLMRLVRLMRIFMELRMIANLIAGTTRSLLGAIMMLLLVLFLAGVCVTEEVMLARQTDSLENDGRLESHFGSLDRTMLTLYQGTSNGILWGMLADELESSISYVMVWFLCLYIVFFSFAMVNIVTGIFVKQSMEAAQESQDSAMVQQINNMFTSSDGKVNFTFDYFKGMLKHPDMVDLLKAINIDPSEAPLLYQLLDDNADGLLDYEEFINGALRLRGPAKSLEFAIFMKEFGAMNAFLTTKLNVLETTLRDFNDRLAEVKRSNEAVIHGATGAGQDFLWDPQLILHSAEGASRTPSREITVTVAGDVAPVEQGDDLL